MNPAAAAPSAARTKRAPELTRICSLSIITSTAAGEGAAAAERQIAAPRDRARGRPGATPRRAKGTISRPQNGASAIASAIGAGPESSPTVTRAAKDDAQHRLDDQQRRVDAEMTATREKAPGEIGEREADRARPASPRRSRGCC